MSENRDDLDDRASDPDPGPDYGSPSWWKLAAAALTVCLVGLGAVLTFPAVQALLHPAKATPLVWSAKTFPAAPSAQQRTYQTRLPSHAPDPHLLAASFGLLDLKPVANTAATSTSLAPGTTNVHTYRNAHDAEIQTYDSFGVTSIYVVHAARASTDPTITRTQAINQARSIFAASGLAPNDYSVHVNVASGLLYVHASLKLSPTSRSYAAGAVGGYVFFDRQGARGMKLGVAQVTEGPSVSVVSAKQAWAAIAGHTTAAAPWAGTYARASLVWATTAPRKYSASSSRSAYLLEPAWRFERTDGAELLVDADPRYVGTVL